MVSEIACIGTLASKVVTSAHLLQALYREPKCSALDVSTNSNKVTYNDATKKLLSTYEELSVIVIYNHSFFKTKLL
jgi:hypothetical protein